MTNQYDLPEYIKEIIHNNMVGKEFTFQGRKITKEESATYEILMDTFYAIYVEERLKQSL